MYTIDWTAVIAVALVALVVVFIRISWTLKEICDAIASRDSLAAGGSAGTKGSASGSSAAKPDVKAAKVDEAVDTEIAAVIAIASQAMRAAS